ncbi:MAG: AlpA family phage regulatory protein [Pseudolabrys sp.]
MTLHRIIRKKQLPTFTGLQRTAIDDLIEAELFPKPIKLGLRSVGWLESEIAAWQAARISRRDATSSSNDKEKS